MSKLFLCFIAIALVQVSYSARLRTAQISTAQTYANAALQNIQQIQTALQNENNAPKTFCLSGDDVDLISYGKEAGQFGTSDFSVGIWIQTTEAGVRIFDVIGNRVLNGHGNFFQIYMYGNHPTGGSGRFAVELDEGKNAQGYGINFVSVQSSTGYNDGKWHHVVVVRKRTSLTLYIDGAFVATSNSSAVTNVAGIYDFIIGRSYDRTVGGRWAGAACYSGPKIELTAWSAQDVANRYASSRPQ